MRLPRRLARLGSLAACALLAAAAGGCVLDEEPAWEPPPGAVVAPEPRPERVVITDFAYRPRRLEVAPGTRITWVNRDEANHTVTFDSGPGALGNVRQGKTLRTRLTRPGRYRYLCAYHPAMRGTVIVREARP